MMKVKKRVIGIAISVSTILLAVAVFFAGTGMIGTADAAEADAEGAYYYTSEYSSREAVLEEGRDLSRQITGEGLVLLKNDNNALPLAKGSHVTVFGKNSVNPVYSGGGSGGGPSGNRVNFYEALDQTGFRVNPYLQSFYEDNELSGPSRGGNYGMIGRTIGIPTYETPVASYRLTETRTFDAYSDAALIFISRYPSEGADLSRSSWAAVTNSRGSTDHSTGYSQVDSNGNLVPVAGRTDGNEHYLELDDNEKDMIELAKASGFKKIVLLINSGNPIEMDFVDTEELGVDAALWIGNPGQTGFLAVGDVLNGDVTPSGHLTDTYARDFTKSPTYSYSGLGRTSDEDGFYAISSAPAVAYESYAAASAAAAASEEDDQVIYNLGVGNAWIVDDAAQAHFVDGEGNPVFPATRNENGTYTVGSGSTATTYGANVNTYSYNRYVKYKDGIYVGYKYYETMAEELDDPETEDTDEGETWYQSRVKYPFGYGMSYTSFDWETVYSDIDLGAAKAVSSVGVKVTNTGGVAGKEVVQLYVNVPYTPGGIEKSAVTLAAYAKTDLLQPGESQTVELSFRAYDLASWDLANSEYILEDGLYTFTLRTDSHTVKTNANGEALAAITENKGEDLIIDEDPTTGEPLEAQFEEAMNMANGQEDFDILSRADMTSEEHVLNDILRADTDAERQININDVQYLRSTAYLPETYTAETIEEELDRGQDYYVSEAPKTSAGNVKEDGTPYMFTDLIGVDSTTEEGAALYQLVVENMSVEELGYLVGNGSHRIAAIESIGLPHQYQEDGPGGFNTQSDSMAFCNNIVIASTWNVELAEQMGELMGEVALWEDIGGWYAPSVNIHKSEFAGRNFEYFSEDSLLSGDMVASQIRGANSKGLMCLLKHFALNEQETDRGRSNDGVCTYADEQTIREIYLRPFEIAVKEGGATGIMGAFNRIGNVWASGYSPLNNDVLRDEWGFRGAVITDASSGQYMRGDKMIRGGTDYDLGSGHEPMGTTPDDEGNYAASNTTIALMQTAAKHIFYAVANSNAINEVLGYIGEDGQFHTTDKLLNVGNRNNYFPLDLTDEVVDNTVTILERIEELEAALANAADSDDVAALLAEIEALQAQLDELTADPETPPEEGGCGSVIGLSVTFGVLAVAGCAAAIVGHAMKKRGRRDE